MNQYFGAVRPEALGSWQRNTHRVGSGLFERYEESCECRWQTHAKETLGFNHISIFCSLADWACNITDILSDPRYDNLRFDDELHRRVLARYFTRVFLVATEQLSDLQSIVQVAKSLAAKPARAFLSEENGWVDHVHAFANRICKHKAGTGNFHECNHHLSLYFQDGPPPPASSASISLGCLDLKNGDSILYPTLSDIVHGISKAYDRVDELMITNEEACRAVCDAYDDPNYAS